jgi:hypothetical protein
MKHGAAYERDFFSLPHMNFNSAYLEDHPTFTKSKLYTEIMSRLAAISSGK